MAVFKCKMCGAALEIVENKTVAECEYCGTMQTLPRKNDEGIMNLFNRANNLRIKCEFDKASQLYEKILNEDNAESEAHWGMVLCKYGIEYVEDPKTYKRVPTCHRTQYESVLTDIDYLSALANSDGEQKLIYKKQAEEISALQKDILAIVEKEKPFDVFICYKETDENGKRTIDSTLANDIYYQLTQEGLKVFYSAITLEDKLGQEYEPYIFAALNSAKVMLVVGTKPEYFEAVWVKNEWSRYMKLMKTDRSKLLIPCYRDMDPYDLPEEFSHLQAQDMSKIGFVNDVVRGVKKLTAPTVEDKPTNNTNNNLNAEADNLVNIGFMELQVGKKKSAELQFRKALEKDTNNSMAYLGLIFSVSLSEKELQIYIEKILELSPEITETEKNVVLKNKDLIVDYIRIFIDCFSESRIKYIYDFYNEYIQTPRIVVANDVCYSVLSYSISVVKNMHIVRLLLEWGVDLNRLETIIAKNGRQYSTSMLSMAITNAKSAEMVELFLKYGANHESYRTSLTGNKYYALSDAIWNAKNIDIVKLLLEAGANPDRIEHYIDKKGKSFSSSMLSSAIKDAKNAEMVDLLLKYGARLETIRTDVYGSEHSALSDAIWNAKNVDIVKLLLKAGEDPNGVGYYINENGKPFSCSMLTHAIIDAESAEIVKLLLQYGARPESTRINIYGNKYSALSDAIGVAQNADIAKLLLEAGADPNKVEHYIGENGKPCSCSMLSTAIIDSKSSEMVKLLLEYGVNPESTRIDIYGNEHSALSDAISIAKNASIVNLLLEAGANPNRVEYCIDENGKPYSCSMLSSAIADAKSVRMVELLLKHGAHPESIRTDIHKNQYYALTDAIWKARNFDIVRMLLEAGANPNRVEHRIGKDGKLFTKSMLTYAIVDISSMEMIDLLLAYGANWENVITLKGIKKVEKKYPFDKKYYFNADFIDFLKSRGWKGSLLLY